MGEQHWAVTVAVDGNQILTIESNCLSGVENISDFEGEIEGAVRLGFRKELEAVPEGPERETLFQQLVAQQYERGGAINMAQALEVDAVIDPAETRRWIAQGLASSTASGGPVAPYVDAW